jgi:hypothetical protein
LLALLAYFPVEVFGAASLDAGGEYSERGTRMLEQKAEEPGLETLENRGGDILDATLRA